jgi:hypothetical protein
MNDGQLAMNTNSASPGLFLKDSSGALVKVGPVHVGTTAPNASPASGGQSGNTVGEQWLDTSGSTYVFKIWDGSAWRSEAGEFVNATGDVMTGALGIIAGSAASPGLYFSGDTNTGIYSPGADQVAISTNGTGRLFVDASGNLTNTRAIATAYSATNAATWTNGLSLYNSSTPGTGVSSFINFTGNANVNSAFGVTQAGSSYGDFVWASFNGSFSERMRLTAGGALALGTSSVRGTSLLDARGDISFGSNANYYGLLSYNAATGHIESTSSDGGFKWIRASGPATSMTLDSSGRLGLGTSAPWSTFTVGSGGTANPAATATIHQNTHSEYRLKLTSSAYNADGNWLGLGFGYSDNYLKAGIIAEAKDGNARTNLHFCLDGNANSDNAGLGDSKMVITYGGNVGIGTNSAISKLHVSNSGAEGFEFTPGSASNTNLLTHYNRNGSFVYVNSQVSAASHQFFIGASEAARIDASSRLLVGTSSGQGNSLLQIKGDSAGSTGVGSIFLQRGLSIAAISGSGTVDLAKIEFGNQDGAIGAVIQANADATWGTNDYPSRLTFSTTSDSSASPSERMRIASDGAIYFQTTATPSTSSYGTVISSGNVFLHSRNTTSAVAQFYGSSGENRLLGNGSIQNTLNSYGAISDAKLKENIEAAGSQWDDLKALEVVNFNFIGSDQRQIGLVAQQVELISPGLVEDVPDDEAGTTSTKGVKYSVLYMKAVKALQEAMERIEALEARIAAAGI